MKNAGATNTEEIRTRKSSSKTHVQYIVEKYIQQTRATIFPKYFYYMKP
jgi:hypothetical protein